MPGVDVGVGVEVGVGEGVGVGDGEMTYTPLTTVEFAEPVLKPIAFKVVVATGN